MRTRFIMVRPALRPPPLRWIDRIHCLLWPCGIRPPPDISPALSPSSRSSAGASARLSSTIPVNPDSGSRKLTADPFVHRHSFCCSCNPQPYGQFPGITVSPMQDLPSITNPAASPVPALTYMKSEQFFPSPHKAPLPPRS